MKSWIKKAAAATALSFLLAGCGPSQDQDTVAPSLLVPSAPVTSAEPSQPVTSVSEPDNSQAVIGTVVRFTAGEALVEAVIEDTPTTRSFLEMLPMTLEFSDYGGREKISYPPDSFDYDGADGMTPQTGDLFSYMPWGNLGFFYDGDGMSHSDSLVRLGTTDDIDQILLLDGQEVTIEIAG